jgi:predicted alpha-1,2-mannosidase
MLTFCKHIACLLPAFLMQQLCFAQPAASPVDWVNPLMGTDSKPSFSNGNTYPVIGRPWGMHYWTPQTGKNGDGWQYSYSADKIVGFKQTHQPSPWMNDYGQFSIMPVTGALQFTEEKRASWFSHKTETATPYLYSVYLSDAGVTAKFSATERAAIFTFTYPQADSAFIVVDAYDKGSYIKIIPGQKKIIGYSTKNSGSVAGNFKNYFVLYFDKAFDLSKAWRDNVLTGGDSIEVQSGHSGAVIGFKTHKGEMVQVKAASSFISFEQAELNLTTELGNKSFEAVCAENKAAWNDKLSRIKTEGGSETEQKTFYSCLYRTLQFPQKHYEIDAQKNIVHYSPYTGKVMPGYKFAGTGFWDTFRALYPFLNLFYPSINKEMQQGLVNDYKEGGWLPEWSSPGYRDVMIGNNSASVVADAFIKGVKTPDIELLYEALKHGANNEGPGATGRRGIEFYNTLGYVPYNVGINENAARTLEYAYDDFCIAQLAKKLGKPQTEIDFYLSRSQNYRNLFDKQSNLMRGKNKDGSFQSPFNPFKWGDAFTEGNSWHYSWSVFHDVEALKNLMGGNKKFIAMLDSVFTMEPVFDESYYGFVIHEIREMQVMNMGQYAHGNQPIQHMIYLYNYAGEPWKAQYWIRQAMKNLYKPAPDGYCGDEDNGQTSAWYVFSALGFYPVCPATEQYVLGTPLFKKVTATLENGRQLIINAPNNSDTNLYVKSLMWNGKPVNTNWISHFDILKGGTLNYTMSAAPATQRGNTASAYPYSYSK